MNEKLYATHNDWLSIYTCSRDALSDLPHGEQLSFCLLAGQCVSTPLPDFTEPFVKDWQIDPIERTNLSYQYKLTTPEALER